MPGKQFLSFWNPFQFARTQQSSNYLPHLDGLRAVAVISVVLFHIWPSLFPIGWLGVDVFFVISGYLMTSILVREISASKLRVGDFLIRRMRRLLPQLIAMILATSAVALVLLNPAQLREFGVRSASSLSYLSNIKFSLEQSYFAETKLLNPLLHTWSLGVEEQFYLLFPLALILVAKLRLWDRLTLIFFFTALASLVAWQFLNSAILFPTFGANVAFYWLPFRAWELLAGGLVALASLRVKFPTAAALLLSLYPLAVLAFGTFGEIWLGGFLNVFAVLATTLVIHLGHGAQFSWLRSRFLVGIGLLSYSIYVWHWPIISFISISLGPLESSPLLAGLALCLTAVFSAAAFRFIETKWRYREALSLRRRIMATGFVAASIATALTTSSAYLIQNPESLAVRTLASADFIYFSELNERAFNQFVIQDSILVNNREALVVGSSRMMQVGSDLTGLRVLNSSVPGATIQDVVTFAVLGQKATEAKDIYIGVDPWMLNENYRDSRWTELWLSFDMAHKAISFGSDISESAKFIENEASQTWLTRTFDFVNISEELLVSIDSEPELLRKKARDGHLILDRSSEENSTVPNDDAWKHGGMDNFVFSRAKFSMLVRLLNYLDSKGAQVTLVLTPYHPEVLKGSWLQDERQVIGQVEYELRSLDEMPAVEVLGSYDPRLTNCSVDEFYDAIHTRISCIDKILRSGIS